MSYASRKGKNHELLISKINTHHLMEDEKNLELEQEQIEETEEKKLTPEQERGIKQRQLTRLAKELGIEIKKPEAEPAKPVEKTEFGLDEMNFLGYKGIAEDDYSYILRELNSTGKRLQDLVKLRYVQDDLKEAKQQREVEAALPESKRAGNISRDNVDYWIAKGELPPWSQRELREQVVNEKIKRQQNASTFTENPIV